MCFKRLGGVYVLACICIDWCKSLFHEMLFLYFLDESKMEKGDQSELFTIILRISISFRILGAFQFSSRNNLKFSPNAYECLQILPSAIEFLAINANLRKIAFGRAFAREIRYI